ncbi:MAG: LIC12162 family protein [Proteobacteria bacterium]|nr:LIC12162 family protein [Pseudomonadota bacterium]
MKEIVLTGFSEFWPADEHNAVFLGPWCFAGNDKHNFWDQKKFLLAPSPWQSPQSILEASLYIDSLTDRIIPPLSNLMNSFHKVAYSERFWEMYFIVWLNCWLGHCYDRYQRLKNLGEVVNEKFIVNIIDSDVNPCRDFRDYMRKMTEGHYYNLQIMSDIIRFGRFDFLIPSAHAISCEFSNEGYDQKSIREYRSTTELGKSRVKFIKKLWGYFAHWPSTSLHLGSIYGLSIVDRICLQFAYDPFFLFRRVDISNLSEIKGNRNDFIRLHFEFGALTEFEKIIERIFLRYVPEALLNIYYNNNNNLPIKYWIGNDIYHSEKKSFSIAVVCENGGKWLSAQHGAGFGQTLSMPISKIDYKISDGFITWGWSYKHIYPSTYYSLPSPMLSKLPKHKQENNQLIIVSVMYPTFFYRLLSSLTPEQQLSHLENKLIFINKLKQDIRSQIRYKPYWYNYGADEVRFLGNVLSPEQFLLKGRLAKEINRSRLTVIDHNGTSVSEAFAMNAPTILFWNPEHFAVSSEATKYFDGLRSADILFDTPEEAAEKVNKIWQDVSGWWRQPEVQKAKDDFCCQYARTDKNWRKIWVHFIKQL